MTRSRHLNSENIHNFFFPISFINFLERMGSFGFLFLSMMFIALNGSKAQLIPAGEVEILNAIATKLHINNWKPTPKSCSGEGALNFTVAASKSQSTVSCSCTFSNGTICHVTNIQLKGLNLTGILPEEIANLTHLRELDLTRNYLSGPIPASFTRLPLVSLTLSGNLINGTIPKEIGDISTLEELVLEDNLLEGPLNDDLGKLKNVRRLLLSTNNFSGAIPASLGNLKNLTDIRLDGTLLSGKIPDFIGNWTKLERLDMQGTSMEAPIPSSISLLASLKELRISDLNGSSSSFPNLTAMTKMTDLVLRNCLLTGSIPDYVGHMKDLKTLDLSFNGLTGEIPDTFQNLDALNYMFLTNNSLSGPVPGFIINSKEHIDLSYNNFTEFPIPSCQQSDVNLVSSFAFSMNNTVPWCSKKDLPCPGEAKHYSLFINCGGGRMFFMGDTYDGDLSTQGPSHFITSHNSWAYSSTGFYLGNDDAAYSINKSYFLNTDGPMFYETARISPLSLKYYGLCMLKGSYKVRLYFAEIQYSNDETFSNCGRRIFDVSIQGEMKLKNFNIMEEAGGVAVGIYKDFDNITVDGSTLEISFYWAGKGTTSIPERGVYGPLISAIAVTPNFMPPKEFSSGKISTAAVIGIVIATICIVLLMVGILWWRGCLGCKNTVAQDLKGLNLNTGAFTLRQVKAATDNFSPNKKIGEGGFGPVYKGLLLDGTVIAVKKLSSKSKQGNREFINEIGLISALQHPHLVKLYGCCSEGNQLLLIYEYMENNSLAHALYNPEKDQLKLDWPTRYSICIGIAKGLAYLHEESQLKIVHRDIKAANVLLDKDLKPKISDFGLAKLDEGHSHMSTGVAGTLGYMAPEYVMHGHLTDKADVYSFGVVALEIIYGGSNTSYRNEECLCLLDWARILKRKGTLLELVDPRLGINFKEKEVVRMINVALLCTKVSPTSRPTMSSVVGMLEGNLAIPSSADERIREDPEPYLVPFEDISFEDETGNFQTALSESESDQCLLDSGHSK